MPSTAGTVMTRAAVHLNDAAQLVYSSAVLLPFLNMALDELEEEMGVFELSPLKKTSIVIDVPAESASLPQMPSDFVEAISLYERPLDSSENWAEVREVADIALNYTVQPQESIVQWTIRNATLKINPPSADREVMLEYVGGLTPATATATAIDIESSRRFLALVTARNAARDAGNSPRKADSFEPDIARARDRLVRRMQKNSQASLGARRLPYRGKI